MSWVVMKMGDFLKHRDLRFKPKDPKIKGLKRIEKIDFSGNIFISEKPSNTDMVLVKKGDLIISGINVEKGAMAIYQGDEDITATIHYSSYEFDEKKIDIDYLKNFLRSKKFTEVLKEQVIGGIKTEIKPKHLLPLEIEVPIDIEEQREIIKHFEIQNRKVEHLDSENNHQLDLLKKLRQQILQDAVKGKLVPQDPNDEPAIKLLERIKAEKEKLVREKKIKKEKPLTEIKPEEIPFEIPENWAWCRLGEMAINRDGERKPISQNEREKRAKIYDYYGASGIIDKIDGYTHDGEFLLIGEDGANLRMKSTPIAFKAKGKFWVNNHAHVLDFVHPITMDYMENCLNGIDINSFITGGFQPKLSQGNLNIIPIPLPTLSEQNRIVTKINQLMTLCDELEQSIQQNQKFTQELLQVALREALEQKN